VVKVLNYIGYNGSVLTQERGLKFLPAKDGGIPEGKTEVARTTFPSEGSYASAYKSSEGGEGFRGIRYEQTFASALVIPISLKIRLSKSITPITRTSLPLRSPLESINSTRDTVVSGVTDP